MRDNIMFSVDVEPDLHSGRYLGITSGLKRFESICDRNKIKPVLFVTADCIKKYPKIFKRLMKKGWEISLHGLTHRRFDDMPLADKEHEIEESVRIFKKYLGIRPKGFRAPQHSIDDETLDILDKYGFGYDSSYTPLNAMQILFFPKRPALALRLSLSRLNTYKIRKNLLEIPTSSLGIPFVSLVLRVFPMSALRAYVKMIKMFYRRPVFYAHSWDFIELKKSRIDRMFPHDKLLKRLDLLMAYSRT